MNPLKLVWCLHGKRVQVLIKSSHFPKLDSIVFIATQEFSCQDISHESIDISDDGIKASGVSIKQILRGMKLEYCIMGKKEVCIMNIIENKIRNFFIWKF